MSRTYSEMVLDYLQVQKFALLWIFFLQITKFIEWAKEANPSVKNRIECWNWFVPFLRNLLYLEQILRSGELSSNHKITKLPRNLWPFRITCAGDAKLHFWLAWITHANAICKFPIPVHCNNYATIKIRSVHQIHRRSVNRSTWIFEKKFQIA